MTKAMEACGCSQRGLRLYSGLMVFLLVALLVHMAAPTASAATVNPQIAAGDSHTLALKDDGTVWAWGDNGRRQLGNVVSPQSTTPVHVSGLSEITAVAAGGSHSLALKADGTVWAWGSNQSGQLGNDSPFDNPAPAQVAGLSGIIAIAAGNSHSLALRNDGTVWAWGGNANGQLGTGITPDSATPSQVNDIIGATAIAAGGFHSVVLKNDGSVWSWGGNWAGQLGNGTTTDNPFPVRVVNLSGVTAVAAGISHTVALKNGEVWGWGSNYSGELGNGSTSFESYSSLPVHVGSITGITAIAAGGTHTVALKDDRTVWTWGSNNYDQSGNGSTYGSTTPVQVTGLADVAAIAAGKSHTMAAKTDGTVMGWGDNFYGQLGNGTMTGSNTIPLQVTGLDGVIAITAGGSHTLALKNDGTVWGWGSNWSGELGSSVPSVSTGPIQVANLADVKAIATGDCHTVALKDDGTVWAWGCNPNGQLGNGTKTSSPVPVPVSGMSNVVAVAAGFSHTVALKGDGTVWAWGYNFRGEIGNSSRLDSDSPVQVMGLSDVKAISATGCHALALKYDATVWGWGCGGSGELGNGNYADSPAPVQVRDYTDPGHWLTGVSAVAAGRGYSLALKSDGTVRAWGWNMYGQLGDGSQTTTSSPVQVAGLADVRALATGEWHGMALKGDGTVWSWGRNYDGELGNGTTIDSFIPVPVTDLVNVAAIAGASYHSTSLKSDGTVWNWGMNYYGQLGDGRNPRIPGAVLINLGDLTVNPPPPSGWTVYSTSGSAIDWPGIRHAPLAQNSYVKIGGTFYRVTGSGTGSWSGTGYNGASLGSCDQQTGQPLGTVPDLSGAVGQSIVYYPGWGVPEAQNPPQEATPELVVNSPDLRWGVSINSLGEIVWSQYDPATQKNQIYSSVRGQLTNDPVDHSNPAINNLGDLVWTEYYWDEQQWRNVYTVKGFIGGQRGLFASSQNGIYKVDLNDRGEVVWCQQENDGTSQIYSNLQGRLTHGITGHYDPSINNQGDIVFTGSDPQQPGPYQVYRLAAGSAAPVAVTNDSMDHHGPAIADSGEIVWAEREMGAGVPTRLVSSSRGQLYSTTADIFALDLNNCGDVAYIAMGAGGQSLYRLGSTAPCISYPGANDVPSQASVVTLGSIFTGLVDVANNPVDWYRFEATAGDTLHIGVNYDNRPPNVLSIGLYDGNGTLLSGPNRTNPLGINVIAPYTGTHYLKLEGQGGRFGYSVSLSKYSTNCGVGPCPDQITNSPDLRWGVSINSLGEIVWSQYDPATQKNQIYSSVRGQLTNDPVDHNAPAVNNLGDLVWTEYYWDEQQWRNVYTVKGLIGGQPVFFTGSQNGIYKVDLNDRGEVVWSQQENDGTSQVYSSLRGQLASGSASHYDPSINNQGDIVFIGSDPQQPGPYQVYKLAAGSATPVAVTNDSQDHHSPAIADSGEIIWAEQNQVIPGSTTRLVSSSRGQLYSATADIFSLDLNNCGDLAYIAVGAGGQSLYRLGTGAPCISTPQRQFPLKVDLFINGNGGGTVSSLLSGLSVKSPEPSGYGFFPAGNLVTLIATPASDSVFAGWSGPDAGACAGSTAPCRVTMNRAMNIAAMFVRKVNAVTLTSNAAGGSVVGGTRVTFTAQASDGAEPYEYQFKLKDPAGAIMEVKPYLTPGNTWEWQTGGLPLGSYTVYVYARSAGSKVAAEASRALFFTIVPDPVDAVTLSSNAPRSTVVAGTPVSFTAQASGGIEPYEYQFKLKDPAGAMTEVKPYLTPGSTWEWQTGGLPLGSYTVYVFARSSGSKAPYEAAKVLSYVLVAPPVTGVTLTSNAPRSIVTAGTQVLFTAQASGGLEPYEYQFKLKDPAGAMTEVKPYLTPGNTWECQTGGLAYGTYTVYVYARSAGSKASYEAAKVLSYVLVAPPVTGVTLTSNAPRSIVTAGTQVLFTAQASGGLEPYEYQFKLKDPAGVISEVKPYLTPGSTWECQTGGLAYGTYTVYVYARSAGSKTAYEAAKALSVTIR